MEHGGAASNRIMKLGEDITETLEVVPRRWKVIQTVREKFSCLMRADQPTPFAIVLEPFMDGPRGARAFVRFQRLVGRGHLFGV
jgi:transposase